MSNLKGRTGVERSPSSKRHETCFASTSGINRNDSKTRLRITKTLSLTHTIPKSKATPKAPKPNTFGCEKIKVDLKSTKSSTPSLLSPTEVKKAVLSQIQTAGTTYKKTNALFSSVKNGTGTSSKEKTIPIQVGISKRGRELLKLPRPSSSPPMPRCSRTSAPQKIEGPKKLKKSKNGESKKMKKPTPAKLERKCNGKAAGSEAAKQLRLLDSHRRSDDSLHSLTRDAIQKQKEAIQSNSFFRHLFWKDLGTLPVVPHATLIAEKARLLQKTSTFAEPTVGALKIYLNHTKPVTDSKFRSLDAALGRSRSASPKSPTPRSKKAADAEKLRSTSLPPKLIFSETSRPISPVLYKKKTPKIDQVPKTSKIIFSQTSRPVSPQIRRKTPVHVPKMTCSQSPSRLVFTETSRPVSPLVTRKIQEQPQKRSEKALKIIFSQTTRPFSPLVKKRVTENFDNLSWSGRSRSASPLEDKDKYPKLYFSETSRPVSPVVERRSIRPRSPPLASQRARSSEKRPQSPARLFFTQLERKTPDFDAESDASNDFACPKGEFVHSPQRCTRFKELNQFYSTLERMGELQRTTSSNELRPRRRKEDEIIDFDRWREVHTRERAEKELDVLYTKLKLDQKEKGFLFQSKNVDSYRWKKDLDRGLRIKDRSVENIKDGFERLKEAPRASAIPDEVIFRKELYKPLWRGNSVVDLATSMVERRSQSEGRVGALKKKLESERLLTHGIGSRIWSSLSSEQINLLKTQLNEIYGKKDNVEVVPPPVWRNPDEFQTVPLMSEKEKRELSQSLSKEVMSRMSGKKASSSLVLGKETRGAIAAAEAKVKSETVSPRTCYSLELSEDEEKKQRDGDFVLVLARNDSEAHKDDINSTMDFWARPKNAMVSTDATVAKTSMSETESGSTDESTKTVVFKGSKEKVQRSIEYFEQVAEEQPYTPTVYKAADLSSNGEDDRNGESPHSRKERKLVGSQSYQDLKEFFGEENKNKELSREITMIRKKSEHPAFFALRRSRSNPELHRKGQVLIPGQSLGDVDSLRRRYEYPWIFSRGRSRIRRGGVVSPVYFRIGDRLMPHINIISKIASLYPKKTIFLSQVRRKSNEELAKILGCPLGEVERLRHKFDAGNISLLGHMFTSSPNVHELRDIAPYLTGAWVAHQYPKKEDNTRSLSSPEKSPIVRRVTPRPKSASPTPAPKPSPILKVRRSPLGNGTKTEGLQGPRPVRYKESSPPQTVKPSVTFKGVVF